MRLYVRVADSIEFTADGPTTLEQVWYPGPPPQYITIDDYTDAMQARSDAVAALNVRMQTGETPYELLKSDAAREEYERLLAVMAGQVEQNDQMPALQEQLAAHPLPTLDPSMSTYEEEERAYNQRLQEQILLDASSPSQPQSPLAVLPTVTPTPAVSDSVPGGIPTERTGFVRHVQFTLYGPEYRPIRDLVLIRMSGSSKQPKARQVHWAN